MNSAFKLSFYFPLKDSLKEKKQLRNLRNCLIFNAFSW